MGLDQIFFRIKRKDSLTNGTIIDIYELKKTGEAEDILWLRKEYEIAEIIRNIYGSGGYGDTLIIGHEDLKKIIDEYGKIIYKEEDNKGWMIMVERQLRLIDLLFDFDNYCLGYEECG